MMDIMDEYHSHPYDQYRVWVFYSQLVVMLVLIFRQMVVLFIVLFIYRLVTNDEMIFLIFYFLLLQMLHKHRCKLMFFLQ